MTICLECALKKQNNWCVIFMWKGTVKTLKVLFFSWECSSNRSDKYIKGVSESKYLFSYVKPWVLVSCVTGFFFVPSFKALFFCLLFPNFSSHCWYLSWGWFHCHKPGSFLSQFTHFYLFILFCLLQLMSSWSQMSIHEFHILHAQKHHSKREF